ncbi:MAG: hypothetical protein ACREPR_01255 [Brasilonema sp.]
MLINDKILLRRTHQLTNSESIGWGLVSPNQSLTDEQRTQNAERTNSELNIGYKPQGATLRRAACTIRDRLRQNYFCQLVVMLKNDWCIGYETKFCTDFFG